MINTFTANQALLSGGYRHLSWCIDIHVVSLLLCKHGGLRVPAENLCGWCANESYRL